MIRKRSVVLFKQYIYIYIYIYIYALNPIRIILFKSIHTLSLVGCLFYGVSTPFGSFNTELNFKQFSLV